MKRGFTIIELLVVITVLATLVGITMVSLYEYENRANDSRAQAIASAVRDGAERYYDNNNEYPSADLLFGGTPTGSIPASYSATASELALSADILDSSRIKFVPCSGDACSFTDKSKVYYLTKADADGTAQRQYTIAGCTYTFPSSEDGTLSYIISYYSNQNGYWMTGRSGRGMPVTSDPALCPFKES